jgi:hypothetical protein
MARALVDAETVAEPAAAGVAAGQDESLPDAVPPGCAGLAARAGSAVLAVTAARAGWYNPAWVKQSEMTRLSRLARTRRTRWNGMNEPEAHILPTRFARFRTVSPTHFRPKHRGCQAPGSTVPVKHLTQ